jgi:hypothetical protein
MDKEVIANLKQSIEEDGFWGGIVCRKLSDGRVQIGAGHHRVAAALAAGVTVADVFVDEDMDDAAMVRVYARENATQRGQTSTAMTGSIASAVKFVAKGILAGAVEEFFHSFDLPTLRARFLGDEGVGWTVILAFLHDIPGINAYSIKHQLANLKASGDYARLIAEVEREIADEQAPPDVQETAHEAAQSAAKTPRTFDFAGVARHLTTPHQVDVFRAEVTSPAVQQYLPVDSQAPLAARLVTYAEELGWHVSGEFIRREISRILLEEHGDFLAFIRREQARLEAEDEAYALERTLERLGTYIRGLERAGRRMARLLQDWPQEKGEPQVPYDVRKDLYDTVAILTALLRHERFHYEPEDPVGAAQSPARPQIPAPRRGLSAGVR